VLLEGYASYQAPVAVPEGSDISMWIWLENYQVSPQPDASTPSAFAQTIALQSMPLPNERTPVRIGSFSLALMT
jgi:hypothetical protein